MAQTTCATMFVWAVLTFLEQMEERRKKEHLAPRDLSHLPQVKIFGLNIPVEVLPYVTCHEGSDRFQEGKRGVPRQRQEVDRLQRQRRPHSSQVSFE